MHVLMWDDLNRFGKNRILQSSYVWLFVVPIAARALSVISDPLVLTGISEGFRIRMTLPFSWHLFYFSAVVVSIAGLIYMLMCPELIQRFNTFAEFRSEGRGIEYLKGYATKLKRQARTEEEGFNSFFRAQEVEAADPEKELPELFWRIHEEENKKFPYWRFVCFSLYFTGLLLIGGVLVQNLVFVIRQLL